MLQENIIEQFGMEKEKSPDSGGGQHGFIVFIMSRDQRTCRIQSVTLIERIQQKRTLTVNLQSTCDW